MLTLNTWTYPRVGKVKHRSQRYLFIKTSMANCPQCYRLTESQREGCLLCRWQELFCINNKYSFIINFPFSKYIFRSEHYVVQCQILQLHPLHTGIIGMFYYSCPGDQTQGFVPVRQELYQLRYTPSPKYKRLQRKPLLFEGSRNTGVLCFAVTTLGGRQALQLEASSETLPMDWTDSGLKSDEGFKHM